MRIKIEFCKHLCEDSTQKKRGFINRLNMVSLTLQYTITITISLPNMKNKIVTFGEIMLRLATPDYQRFTQTNSYNATFGGGEANVAVSLAN